MMIFRIFDGSKNLHMDNVNASTSHHYENLKDQILLILTSNRINIAISEWC